MKKLTHLFASFFITLSAAGVLAVAAPQPVSAACSDRLLTFPAWYRGIQNPETCEVNPPSKSNDGLSKFIWTIVLNIIDMLMQLVGYASVIFLIIGGFKYMTATGESTKMTAAKSTITNAIIGLVIALASVAIVNTIAGVI